jgi:hypothetical protein
MRFEPFISETKSRARSARRSTRRGRDSLPNRCGHAPTHTRTIATTSVWSTASASAIDHDQDEESLRDFFDVSSPFYLQLAAYYDDRAEDWYLSVRLEWLEGECETPQGAASSRQIAGDQATGDGWALLRAGTLMRRNAFSGRRTTTLTLSLASRQ